MDATQSNLSLPNYGYDMVVATTQESINATMKQLLEGFDNKKVDICYMYDGNGVLTQTDFNALVTKVGIDPFSIVSGTYHKTDPVAQFDKAGFGFAFQATMGLPDTGTSPFPDILLFNKGNASVTYQLFCKEFKILSLEESGGGRNLNWTNLSQPAGTPWIFTMNVNLELKKDNTEDAFSKLPIAAQNAVKNLNPDSPFSVQQLYLDLNTASLESFPDIALDTNSNAATYLTKVFLNAYLSNLSAGKVILGYTVQPDIYNPNVAQPSVIPTDLGIEVSSHLNADGTVSGNFKLYTLNYLVMSQGSKMPAPVQFAWNWIEENQAADYDGSISVRRGILAEYMNTRLSPWLNTLCLDPQVNVTASSYSCTASPAQAPARLLVNDKGPVILNLDYQKAAYAQSGPDGTIASLKVTYHLTSSVTCTNKQIVIDTTAAFYMEVSHLLTTGKGNALKYQSRLLYNCGTDGQGNITILPAAPDIQNLSDAVDSATWGKMSTTLSAGEFKKLLETFTGFLQSNSFLVDGFDDYLRSSFQSNRFWIFPGGKTMNFKNIFFSDNQDLVTLITCQEPG